MVSRLDDSKIIDLFYERSEQAIIELSQKYGSVCTKVANNILNDVRDTEECVNDAYLGAWNTIPPQRPNPLLSYVCRIVRNLAIKKYHANTAAKRNSSYDVALDELENCFPASTSVEDEFNAGEIARSIDRFLETLDKENRIMFVRRYWHSDSIADLRQYAAEHGLTVVDEYIDDGWSGTNFERPSFQRMIDDIEDGKINCVVTKDLSRLGRNYILTGQYTEIYFPSKGVRYIAINDNVDTINGESELAPFLNILNEMHARQTSKKVKAAMHTRFANGAHYGAYAPLGYVKDPDKKGHFLIDPETRWIVEKIFDLAVHGRGAASITRILVEEKVPTPGWLNYERYGTFRQYLRRCARRKSLCVDDCTGQEHFERGNLHRSQRSQQAEQHFIQEQEKSAEAAGRMVSCGKYPRSHHFRRSVPKSSGADCKQTQETQKWYNTDFRRIDKMCRLRMVFSLWGKQAE